MAMPDTTVYVHIAQAKAPQPLRGLLIGGSRLLHAAPCLSEVLVAVAALDPEHPRTPARREVMLSFVRQAQSHRVNVPTQPEWYAAALLAGLIMRLQDWSESSWRSLLTDGLLLLTARRVGATVVTANTRDFDLLTQLVPDVRVAFYRPI